MKKTIFNLLPGVFLWLSGGLTANGDPPSGCCYVIQLVGSQLEDCSATGEFQPVSVLPLEPTTVTLQFGISLAGTEVVIQSLDGGTLGVGGSGTIDQDGNLSFPFQAGPLPGLYRVSVIADNDTGSVSLSLVQLQVPNPE
jgi:hypothetical protein